MPHRLRVGVLSPFVGGDYYGAIIAGVNAAATADGGRVIAFQTLDPGAKGADWCGVPDVRHDLGWQHFEAAVVLPGAVDDRCVRRLQQAGKRVVLVSHDFPDVAAPMVCADNRSGVREAVDHLVAHGHRRIAFGGMITVSDIRERYEGYLEGVRAHGLPSEPALFFRAPDNHESGGVAVADDLLAAAKRDGGLPATALVLGTDRNAIGLIGRLSAAGHCLPEELAVVGFDDIADGWFVEPSLSSIHQPLDRIGALAYEQACALVAGSPSTGRTELVPTHYVPRTSCGCPKAGLLVSDAQARSQFEDNAFLQMTLNTQYELGIELLRTHERDPRAMAWLGRTPAVAGCLGMWPGTVSTSSVDPASGPADRDDPDPEIEVVGGFRADGRKPPAVGRIIPVSTFPPDELFDLADGAAGQAVFVVPVRSHERDWGLMAAVGRIQDSTPPGREMMNHSGSLLAVALDHDTVLRSLTEQKEQLRRAALYDHLTGLPNRTLFLDRLGQAGHRASRRPDRHFALFFLDLDGFKAINDTRGHAAGDEVLVQVAERIRAVLRRTDTAARLGGDEFVVLVEGLGSSKEAGIAAERVRLAVCRPMMIGAEQVSVGVSIGMASSSDGFDDPEELLRRADAAMYAMKTSTRQGGRPRDRTDD